MRNNWVCSILAHLTKFGGKMKKRIFTVLAILIVAVTSAVLFAACDKTDYVEVSALFSEDRQTGDEAATAERISVPDGSVLFDYDSDSDLIVFSQIVGDGTEAETVYTVYSVTKGNAVYSDTGVPRYPTYNGVLIWPDVFYVESVGENEEKTVSFYSCNGAIVENVKSDGIIYGGEIAAGRFSEQGLDIGGGKVIKSIGESYVVADKKISMLGQFAESETIETDNYRVAMSDLEMLVLDRDFNVLRTVSYEEITGAASGSSRSDVTIILPDDKVLVQQTVMLPQNTTKDYDLYASGGYYKVKTYIYDIEKDKTNEVKDFGYLFSRGYLDSEAGVSLCSVRKINEDKDLGSSFIQAFDGDLNVALDIQKILPYCKSVWNEGKYTLFESETRIVIYEGNNKVLDASIDKFDVNDSYLASSGVLLSVDNQNVFDAEGLLIASLEELDADSWIFPLYWKNSLYYTKTEPDDVSGLDVTYLYRLDRKTGQSFRICTKDELKVYDSGTVMIASAEYEGKYDMYDLVDFGKIAEGFDTRSVNVVNVKGGELFVTQKTDGEGATITAYYLVTR